MRKQQHIAQFLRFVCAGGACFVANLAVLYIGTEIIGLHYLQSTFLSIIFVSTLGWYINRKHTFRTLEARPLPELLRYSAINLLSISASLGAMYILVSIIGIHYLAASVILATSMTLVNFLAHRKWSFKVTTTATPK